MRLPTGGAKLGGANGVRGGLVGPLASPRCWQRPIWLFFVTAASFQDVVRDRATGYPNASAATQADPPALRECDALPSSCKSVAKCPIAAVSNRSKARHFAVRALRNIGSELLSLRLDVGRPHHLAPFLGFVGDKLAEL